MINKKNLEKIIETDNDYLKINKRMIRVMGVDAAVLYTYLLSIYFERCNDYSYYDNYFLCNVDEIQKCLNFSPFKQRSILNELTKYKLIKIKYGQSRTRYISINEDLSILNNLLYGIKYQKFENKLISYIIKNIENLYEEEDFDSEDSIQLYNYLSKINFNKSIKESEEYKNLELEWLSMPENIKQQGNNERTRVLVKR